MSAVPTLIRMAKPLSRCCPRLGNAYRLVRDNWPLREQPKVTPMGFKLLGHPLMEKGEYEPQETKFAEKALDDADVFINVGANVGYYCCLALLRDVHTIAFEPLNSNLRYLYKNIEANSWQKKIEIYPLALSDEIGFVKMYGGGTGASMREGWADIDPQYTSWVPTSTLDVVLGSRMIGKRCFITVDIEGAEKRMLDGARTLLSANPKPVWMIEIAITEHLPKGEIVNPKLYETFDLFWSYGYEAWTIGAHARIITQAEVSDTQSTGNNKFQSNNFAFVEKGMGTKVFG